MEIKSPNTHVSVYSTGFEIEERMGRSIGNDLLESSLVEVQKVMGAADKSTKGYGYKYAKYNDLIEASRPVLTEWGLSVRHRFMKFEGEWICRTILAHKSGQWTSSDYPIREIEEAKKSLEQSLGTWITYIKRYQYMSIIGLAVDDESDNDGHRVKEEAPKDYYRITEKQIVYMKSKMAQNPVLNSLLQGVDISEMTPKEFENILRQFENKK